jgi:hypothetical protein
MLGVDLRNPGEGLTILDNFGLVQEAFESPDPATDREHRQAVLGYLKEDGISALPFQWLAGADAGRASLPSSGC